MKNQLNYVENVVESRQETVRVEICINRRDVAFGFADLWSPEGVKQSASVRCLTHNAVAVSIHQEDLANVLKKTQSVNALEIRARDWKRFVAKRIQDRLGVQTNELNTKIM